MSQEQTIDILRLIDEQPRKFKVWPIDGFYRAPGHQVLNVAIVLLNPAEDDDVLVFAADRRVALSKKAKHAEAAEIVRADDRLRVSAETLEALCLAVRYVKPDGTPGGQVFQNPDAMRSRLTDDNWLALHNMYRLTKEEMALAPALTVESADEIVEKMAPALASNIGTDIPKILFAPRSMSETILIASLMAAKLTSARQEVVDAQAALPAFVADREAAESALAAARVRIAELEAALAARPEPAAE